IDILCNVIFDNINFLSISLHDQVDIHFFWHKSFGVPYIHLILFNPLSTLFSDYPKLNDRFAVQEQYEALVTMLLDEFDETPDSEVQDWYNNWKEKQS